MISFNYENDFILTDETIYESWIASIIKSESKFLGDINYIFCNDEQLLKINIEYLDHDTLTDIISFDYSEGNLIQGDIFISTERVQDNANDYEVSFVEELKRVMAHGVLHYCGYKDKTESDSQIMRNKEEEKIKLFHVEL